MLRPALIFLACGASLISAGEAAERTWRLESPTQATESIADFDVIDSTLILRGPPPRKIPMSDIVSLRRGDRVDDWSQRTSLVWLSNGDRLVGEPVDIDEDAMTVRWLLFPSARAVEIRLEYVAAICLQTPASATGRQKLFRMLASVPERQDVAWLLSGDRIAGEFTGLVSGEFLLTTDTGKLPILREKLLALKFDPELVATVKSPATRCQLTLSDGSRLTVEQFERRSERLTFKTLFGVEVTLPADALLGIQVFSPRIQPLSQRKPAQVKFTPYLDGDWPWMKDRNVLAGPLQLRGREFAHGLGVHSRTALTWDLEPKDREFRAVVGIDDLAEDAGHAIFSVAVDDKIVWTSPGLAGTSEPLEVPPVDLAGGKRLTLTVDFGEQGDVRDYANWCDAIIICAP